MASQYTDTMNFNQVIQAIDDGYHVTRIEWHRPEAYCFKDEDSGIVMLHLEGGQKHEWLVNDGDRSATDWVIV